MTDRELLGLAAKAAGYLHLTGWTDRVPSFTDPRYGEPALTTGDQWGETWNPLADKGDALRLAEQLLIAVAPMNDAWHAMRFQNDSRGNSYIDAYYYDWDAVGETPQEAIVNCAALIGQGMS